MFNNVTVEVLVVLYLGLLLGSFSTAIVYRTRHNQSWIWNKRRENKARSFCPSCGHTLGLKDLFPIFSWLFQKGRCRYCQASISSEYIFLEIAVVLVCFTIYGATGLTKQGVLLMFLSPFFVSQGLLAVKYKLLSKLLLLIIVIGGISLLFL